MLTSEQLRAGRALARLDQKTLAEAAGISVPTLKRLEAGTGPLSTLHQNAERLRSALEAAGVVFLPDGEQVDGGPGVRLRKAVAEPVIDL